MALSIGDVRIPPKADIAEHGRHVRFVPKAEVAVIRSVELIVQPDAHDVVGEMGVGSHGSGQREKNWLPQRRQNGRSEGRRGVK
jgi:hypothetical protein